jgi:2-keto-4-pentenoate hydratase/2-oxohepta-3-ene-1,7-dioic acid hydratase in catechol pathway
MRIVRFEDPAGQRRAGVERQPGIAEVFETDSPLAITTESTGGQARIERRLAPVAPTNIYCIGLNYRRHARETGQDLPEQPVVFMKPTSAVTDPASPIRLPRCQRKGPEVDYEGELAVVIGRAGRDIAPSDALAHVLGYTVAQDVSARRWQKHGGGGQWVRGKSFDTFCPLGPALVTPDEITDPQQLGLTTTVNGQVMQKSHTSDMIFTVAELIAFLSQDTTLRPGTVILTGTPEGVGVARQPPVFLQAGDSVTVTIDGIGELTNPVAEADDR